MPSDFLIVNARIVNEGSIFNGSVWVQNELIKAIFREQDKLPENIDIIDAHGHYLLPGVIDDQVHFREPGLTHKGDIHSESRAAVAGGVTSFMDMPNTIPQTTTLANFEEKMKIASERSLANYSFYFGANNDNIDEVISVDKGITCGIKVFMGSSTGNMLVDNEETLAKIFKNAPILVAIHSEYEPVIRANTEHYLDIYGENIPIRFHPAIRSEEACYRSTVNALKLAGKYDTRLHILHLSTAKETELLDPSPLSPGKRITAEVCVHHLWFTDENYESLGTLIKWNPAIKTRDDRWGLLKALKDGRIDVVATDHAPHTFEEKNNTYFKAPSGGPLVQHSLPLMFELVRNGDSDIRQLVQKMCHNMAVCFNIEKRGYIREGYFADLVIVDPTRSWVVDRSNILYKCGWSPLEGTTFNTRVTHTFVNGHLVYNDGLIDESFRGQQLKFRR
jgi:dihydroorotase